MKLAAKPYKSPAYPIQVLLVFDALLALVVVHQHADTGQVDCRQPCHAHAHLPDEPTSTVVVAR